MKAVAILLFLNFALIMVSNCCPSSMRDQLTKEAPTKSNENDQFGICAPSCDIALPSSNISDISQNLFIVKIVSRKFVLGSTRSYPSPIFRPPIT